MIYDTFISYSSDNKDLAFTIVKILESRNFKCWISPRNYYSGYFPNDSVEIALKSCNCFVYLFSVDNNNFEIPNELITAKNDGLHIIPVRLNSNDNIEIFNEIISPDLWIDYITDQNNNTIDLISQNLLEARKNIRQTIKDNFLMLKEIKENPAYSVSYFSKRTKVILTVVSIIGFMIILYVLMNIKTINSSMDKEIKEQTTAATDDFEGSFVENEINNVFFCYYTDSINKDFVATSKLPVSDNFSILIYLLAPLEINSVKLHINKFNQTKNTFEYYSSHKYDVSSKWNKLVFNNFNIKESGIFRVLLTNSENVTIVSGIVQIVPSSNKFFTSKNELLYFCERYIDVPINTSDRFTTGSISVIYESPHQFNLKEVWMKIEKFNSTLDSLTEISNEKFSVNPNWNLIHFDDVTFGEEGFYKISILNKKGDIFTDNILEIVPRNY